MEFSKFLSFYMDMSDEEPEYIEQFLREAGVDFEESRAQLVDALKEIDAREMMSRGKAFKEKCDELLSNPRRWTASLHGELKGPQAAFAFSKLDHMSDEDAKGLLSEMEKLDIIARAKEETGVSKEGKEENADDSGGVDTEPEGNLVKGPQP